MTSYHVAVLDIYGLLGCLCFRNWIRYNFDTKVTEIFENIDYVANVYGQEQSLWSH